MSRIFTYLEFIYENNISIDEFARNKRIFDYYCIRMFCDHMFDILNIDIFCIIILCNFNV